MAFRTNLQAFLRHCQASKDILLGKYPSFVYRARSSADELPVFCFHSVQPDSFEAMLQFLESNKYNTLSLGEFYNLLRNTKQSVPSNPVLLTFDDGMASLWSVAYPLLKKYKFRATAFVIPGKIKGLGLYRPNLEDVWSGRALTKDVLSSESNADCLASWEEIRKMHEERVMDFQSHTLEHSLIFTSPRIVDFVNPECILKYHFFEFSMFAKVKSKDEFLDNVGLGAPIYSSAPRMAGKRRYLDDERLREQCINFVEKNGRENFFDSKNWKECLFAFAREYRRQNILNDKYETTIEQQRAIFRDLKNAKDILQRNLLGKRVMHLAYPWGIGSKLSMKLSKEAGYSTNFWGKADNSLRNIIGQDPYKISRISEDFLYLLPGVGRRSLWNVLSKKIQRRWKRGSPFLSH